MTKKKWLPLESNPEVIESYGLKLGMSDVLSMADVYSTDDWALETLTGQPVAFLFLYPITPASEAARKEVIDKISFEGQEPPSIWFTRQTVGNACGTVALLHAVANLKSRFPPQPKSFFDSFLTSTALMSPDDRAVALESDNDLESAHRSVETQGQSEVKDVDAKVNEHFVAFVEHDGCVFGNGRAE
eukprot:CAMPEP_0113848028 /NCGR_PEP_ID=MMETSP0372-20130328/2223_1 /TAXON_ID=340204 /ORGANISM="Lankesteria abbotti" /LENGTH=186 /DNA_ID=CAMNT_0000817413 /DNA_START=176 /DNA_END=736 /DNA_ORIENTATION=- /assembly_acc=CAM_ASM_000359